MDQITPEVRSLRRQVEELTRRLDRAQRDIERRPIHVAPGFGHSYSLLIDTGNLLDDGVTNGIKQVSTISFVLALYDPVTQSSFMDGIGRATLFVDGVSYANKVLVVNDRRQGSMINQALFTNDRVLTFPFPVQIPYISDPTQYVTAYIPYFL